MTGQTNGDQYDKDRKRIEREIEEDVEKWIRERYHDALREEISTKMINWLRLRYSVIALILSILAFFGIREYVEYRVDKAAASAMEETISDFDEMLVNRYTALHMLFADLRGEGANLAKSLAEAETQTMLLDKKREKIEEGLTTLETKVKSIKTDFSDLAERTESQLMLLEARLRSP